ncbi:MAG TPA: hypothetical protein VMV03_14940 [Spirochaetia bacterium]|nr:hypothetical protein [Spirochaetia bacterium]
MRSSGRGRSMGAAAAAAAAAFLLAVGCSNKPPEIARIYARVVYQHDTATGTSSEGLSVFLVASDPDGLENLSSFFVINDDAELFWKVDSASWITSTAEGETWVGSNSLDMPTGMSVPAGSYRVILQNAGGDTAEETFSVPGRPVSAGGASYPSATVRDGAIQVAGSWQSLEVWTYGKDGKFAASFPATKKGPPLAVSSMAAAVPALSQGFTFRLFAGEAKDSYNVLSGPYSSGAVTPAGATQPAGAPQPAGSQPAAPPAGPPPASRQGEPPPGGPPPGGPKGPPPQSGTLPGH